MILLPWPIHRPAGSSRLPAGFSITALIITVAIMFTLAGISIPLGLSSLRRQRLNNLVTELSGWLEEISVRTEFAGAPCQVSFTTGSLSPGDTLAQVTPSSCATQDSFDVPSFLGPVGQTYGIQITDQAANGAGRWSFTSRGTIDEAQDIEIRVNLNNNAPVRCIQLSADFGLIRLGANNDANVPSIPCTNYRRI